MYDDISEKHDLTCVFNKFIWMTLKLRPYQRQRLHHDLKSKANFLGSTSQLPHDHMLIIIRLDQCVSVTLYWYEILQDFGYLFVI